MRILIADDEVATRKLLEKFLGRWGHEVVSVGDGNEAWAVIREPESPPLLLLDRCMPGVSGIDLCKRIRYTAEEAPKYVILLTGMADRTDLLEGFQAGADDYITKPFDPDELRMRIRAGERIVELQQKLAERVRELREAVAHIETLHQVLPICTQCHKVHSEDSSWEELETYVASHSPTEFSHGLCPDCLRKQANSGE